MDKEELEKTLRAGKIARETLAYAREFIKPGMKLIEIAEKLEGKINELGGKPAFPVNLSINDIAAHYTPGYNDEEVAHGLLKVDVGAHVDGYAADTAITLDLEGSEENKKLIKAAEEALTAALEVIGHGVVLSQVGRAVQDKIESYGFNPIINLSGHEIRQYDLHAGINIPNCDSGQKTKIGEGLFAVEPFSTNGHGKVRDSKGSGIFTIAKEASVRDNFAREVLGFIVEEYDSLPFCSRWIHKKFGSRGLLALRQILQAGVLHEYPVLVETGKGKIAQAEHSVLLYDGKKVVTTRD